MPIRESCTEWGPRCGCIPRQDLSEQTDKIFVVRKSAMRMRAEGFRDRGCLLAPFFLDTVQESGGAFSIVLLRVDRIIEILELFDVVLWCMLVVSEE